MTEEDKEISDWIPHIFNNLHKPNFDIKTDNLRPIVLERSFDDLTFSPYEIRNNLQKHVSGLYVVVWVGTKSQCKAGHSHERVKIRYGGKEIPVSLHKEITNEKNMHPFERRTVKQVRAWIENNQELLDQYWDEKISFDDFVSKLKLTNNKTTKWENEDLDALRNS